MSHKNENFQEVNRQNALYKSIRSLPKGIFEKHRQMFANAQTLPEKKYFKVVKSKTHKILELPVTDDEKLGKLNTIEDVDDNGDDNQMPIEKSKKFIFGYEKETQTSKPIIQWSPIATKKVEIEEKNFVEAHVHTAPVKPPRTFKYDEDRFKLETLTTNLDEIFNINTIHEFHIEAPKSPIYESIDYSRAEKTKSTLVSTKPKALKTKSNLKSLSKLTTSEPNLSNAKNGNLLSRAFKKIKDSLSKTNVNENSLDETKSLESDSLELVSSSSGDTQVSNKQEIYETITKRVEKNRRNYQDLFDNQTIYTNPRELALKSLFDYCLIVSLRPSDISKKSFEPYVLWKFPDKIANFETRIVEFCFPNFATNEMKQNESEIFQFILTNIDGTRTYGYCLRIFSKTSQPIVYCIISPIDTSELFNTILLETKNIHLNEENEDLDDTKCLLAALYSKPLPKRGETLQVTFGTRNIRKLNLKRSLDRRLEHIHVDLILQLSHDLIIKIFSSMLAEKKIIFLSNRLSVLSSTIQAFETLLYPFNWPHTFIPVLPSYLIEMCEAPTPYVIGLLRHTKSDLTKLDLFEVLIVDLDKNRCLQEDGNEMSILPSSASTKLKQKIYALSLQKTKIDNERRNRILLNAFIDIFVDTIGHYNNYFYTDPVTKMKKFCSKDFIANAHSQQIKEFLEWFTKTQLFEVFISNKCSESIQFGLAFEKAIKEKNFEIHVNTKMKQKSK